MALPLKTDDQVAKTGTHIIPLATTSVAIYNGIKPLVLEGSLIYQFTLTVSYPFTTANNIKSVFTMMTVSVNNAPTPGVLLCDKSSGIFYTSLCHVCVMSV